MEIEVEGLAMVAVLCAAKDWFESNRPAKWSDEQHLAQPWVNAGSDDAGKRLAVAIGQMIAMERMN